jgi:hypothetical protein
MIVRKVLSKDMPTINDWWRCHGWPPINKYMLSSDGYLAEKDGQGVVAAWYGKISNSQTALMEWMVKNPNSNKEDTYKGFDLIREQIENQSKADGFKILMTIIEHKNLKKFFSDSGFLQGDQAYDTYLKILK